VPFGKRNASRLTPAAVYRLEMSFRRQGMNSESGLWGKSLTSTRIPPARFFSICPANKASYCLNSSPVIAEVESFQSIPINARFLVPENLQELYLRAIDCLT